jgi:hypothetical protein
MLAVILLSAQVWEVELLLVQWTCITGWDCECRLRDLLWAVMAMRLADTATERGLPTITTSKGQLGWFCNEACHCILCNHPRPAAWAVAPFLVRPWRDCTARVTLLVPASEAV